MQTTRPPMSHEAHHHAHLSPPSPPVDLSCPGLMLAANASLVLGYLWLGWLSDGSQSATVLEFVRGGVLPLVVAIAIFGLRPACARRALPGSSVLLPAAATIALVAAIAADANRTQLLAVTAGGAALLVASLADRVRAAARGRSGQQMVGNRRIARTEEIVCKRRALDVPLRDRGRSAVHEQSRRGQDLSCLEPGLEARKDHRPAAVELRVRTFAQLVVGEGQTARVTDGLDLPCRRGRCLRPSRRHSRGRPCSGRGAEEGRLRGSFPVRSALQPWDSSSRSSSRAVQSESKVLPKVYLLRISPSVIASQRRSGVVRM